MTSRKKYSSKIIDHATYKKLNKENQKYIIKAEKGDEQSIIYVSNSFIIGKNGFPQNKEFGIKYLQSGVEHNYLIAMEQYGTYLLSDDVIPQDEEKAVKLLNEVATKRRDPSQKLELVKVLLSHQSFDIDSTANSEVNYYLAKQICKEAADLGCTESMAEYGKLCMKTKKNKYGEIKADFKEALQYFKASSQKGNPEGMFNYGIFIENGYSDVKIDLKEAAKLYKKSFEKGNLNGYCSYGYSMILPKFNQLNEVEGIKLMKFSCDNNCPFGLNGFGYLYDFGIGGIDKDDQKAFNFYKKSADLGCHNALNNIGCYYRDGLVVEKDLEIGLKYLELALEEGSAIAAHNLALTFSEDKYGAEVDKEKAAEYFEIAVNFGYRPAISDFCWLFVNDSENLSKNADKLKELLDYGESVNDINTLRLKAALYLDGGEVYEKNQTLAVDIMKKCVELGSKEAASNLADIYEKGLDEIKADKHEATKYRKLADGGKVESKCCLLI